MTNNKIGVIGLGYVGLPLARLFSTKFQTIGFDTNPSRIAELKAGKDSTLEVEEETLSEAISKYGLHFTAEIGELRDCNFYIVTVPTPINKDKCPELTPLRKASQSVGRVISKGDIVVFESTVYPGVTEEECIPIIEEVSHLKYNKDFFAGYSPERINPGDKEHTVERIKKITSGSTPSTADEVDKLYSSVIKAGTYKAPTIKVAEAAKVIENSQRDINIAFVNELSKIFDAMGIDTQAVLEAAATKWNFIKFTPGLVGGHCIGVDPYYLSQCAQRYGYNPEIILSGRRMNDSMGSYVASSVIKAMIKKGIQILGAKILILGITFKENCPDTRGTKVVDVIKGLEEYGATLSVVDPWADAEKAQKEFQITMHKEIPHEKFDAFVITVAHNEFRNLNLEDYKKEKSILYDVKWISENPDKKL
ncbi:MAG: nucleotide sugar dehydrogenase [Rikenellaceae bacterium]